MLKHFENCSIHRQLTNELENDGVRVRTCNALNQYTSRTVPGTAQVRGFADSGATVTVNGNGTWRYPNLGVAQTSQTSLRSGATSAAPAAQTSYFYGGDDADNSALPVFKEVAIEALRPAATPDDYDEVAAVTGRVFVAQNPEQFTYDADGNMTCDGRFRYTWNAENRLVRAQELVAPTNRHPYTVTYAYDHQGRMVTKRITENDGHDTLVKSIAYIWDGWNIIREIVRDGDGSATITDNVWGLDLNGTLQGAGGVGGLLAVIRSDSDSNSNSNSSLYLPTYDANGNVSEYVSTDGSIVAHYDYSPFGETLIETGDLAATFTHRFSTKPWCPVTGLCEYQMRKYRPGIGRWLSRDPIGEREGGNIYAFLKNFHVNTFEYLGLYSWSRFWDDAKDTITIIAGAATIGAGAIILGGTGLTVGGAMVGAGLIALGTDSYLHGVERMMQKAMHLPPPDESIIQHSYHIYFEHSNLKYSNEISQSIDVVYFTASAASSCYSVSLYFKQISSITSNIGPLRSVPVWGPEEDGYIRGTYKIIGGINVYEAKAKIFAETIHESFDVISLVNTADSLFGNKGIQPEIPIEP